MQALLVIDVQQGLFDFAPLNGEAVVARIADLIAKARAAGLPVFYVQHDGGPGDELDPAAPGYAFRPEIVPQPGDVVTVKHHCNAFRDTGLDDTLKAAGITDVVISGLQTDYCIDTAVRAAYDRGYRVIVARDAHTTCDSALLPAATIIAHTENLWNNRFAKLQTVAEITF